MGGGGNQAGAAQWLVLLSQSEGAALPSGRDPEATRGPRLSAIGDGGYAPRPAPPLLGPALAGRLGVTSFKVLILDPRFPLPLVPQLKRGRE